MRSVPAPTLTEIKAVNAQVWFLPVCDPFWENLREFAVELFPRPPIDFSGPGDL